MGESDHITGCAIAWYTISSAWCGMCRQGEIHQASPLTHMQGKCHHTQKLGPIPSLTFKHTYETCNSSTSFACSCTTSSPCRNQQVSEAEWSHQGS